MSDERKRRWWPAALASILLMYPLSIGPAYRLVIAGYLDFDVCLEAYMPVLWVAEQSDLADKLLQWYMQLWAPQNIEAYH